jgi:hypothetical protein
VLQQQGEDLKRLILEWNPPAALSQLRRRKIELECGKAELDWWRWRRLHQSTSVWSEL